MHQAWVLMWVILLTFFLEAHETCSMAVFVQKVLHHMVVIEEARGSFIFVDFALVSFCFAAISINHTLVL